MKAMVLAAGVGSRLRPLTDRVPKALIEVGGVPMIEHVIRRLQAAGVTDLVVNVHHLADRIVEFLAARGHFGLRVAFSREPALLDTGGGLKQAAWFFDDGRPFFLHNVDVLSDIDLPGLLAWHEKTGALATLAVQPRRSARQLLFDAEGTLCGHETPRGVAWAKEPVPAATRLAFAGIHVIGPALLARITEAGAFPITRPYLRLAGEGERIVACRADGAYWQDIGSAEALEAARRRAATTSRA
jgi:NDP-sugar pyrophosphorylase family protein